ncbi:hypothetical protein L1N85_15375 [Paenibacillus alkaliterrae]|uniref:hypothetical protein n=1 Tax=Paenibacillus alkaliterrae TaxID=320909 RepID=UPI001F1F94A3|nr:hypothetical protein [Paenibacillus alkaliterrae]MCF2939800.1 hypothetical protein [Paenibacillus alkaliterrae]
MRKKVAYKEYKTALKPIRRVKTRAGTAFIFQTVIQAGLFQRSLNLRGVVNSSSRVFVSITEIGLIGGTLKPFQGSATMTVHNVVPQDDGIVLVRGNTGWNSPLNVRLSVVVF